MIAAQPQSRGLRAALPVEPAPPAKTGQRITRRGP